MMLRKRFTQFLFAACGMVLMLIPISSQAQCPSVTGSGDPAVILLNIYGIPNGNYFTPRSEELQIGVSPGIQIGAIFSPQVQLVTGVEFSWIKRDVEIIEPIPASFNYRTRFLEIPVDFRFRLGKNKPSEFFLTMGAGFVLSNVRESSDPTITIDETLYHQTMARLGFEHTITVKKTFNILWGLLGKADVLALAQQESDQSYLNGSYYGGLKLGLQFAL